VHDDDETPLSREAIERRQNELSKLSPSHLREMFNSSYINCAPKDGEIPSPRRIIQSFLTIWKVLWGWKQNAKPQPITEDNRDSG
jgi:hypothetical protein